MYGFLNNDANNYWDYLGANPGGFGTPDEPNPPYNISVGQEKTVADEIGKHVPNCCFWPLYNGEKPGKGTGNKAGWRGWYLGHLNQFNIPLSVRQKFANNIVDGLGLENSWAYGGDLDIKITLKRNSTESYTWKIVWRAINVGGENSNWKKGREGKNYSEKTCSPFSPSSNQGATSSTADIFKNP